MTNLNDTILGMQCDLENAHDRFAAAVSDTERKLYQSQLDVRSDALEKAAEGVTFSTIPASELRVCACVRQDTTWSPAGWVLKHISRIDRDGGMIRVRYSNGGLRDFRPTDLVEVA